MSKMLIFATKLIAIVFFMNTEFAANCLAENTKKKNVAKRLVLVRELP